MAQNTWLVIVGVIFLAVILAFFLLGENPVTPIPNGPATPFSQAYAPISAKAQQLELSSDGKINIAGILDLKETELNELQTIINQTPNQNDARARELREILLLAIQATQTRQELLNQITTIEGIPPSDYCQNLSTIERRETLGARMISQLEEVMTRIDTFSAQYPAESSYSGLTTGGLDLSAFKANQSLRELLLNQSKADCGANNA